MKYNRYFAILFLILMLTAKAIYGAEPFSSSLLTIATGRQDGDFYRAGKELAGLLHDRISLNILNTEGSFENIELLHEGEVDLALSQQDAFSDYYTRTIHENRNLSIEVLGILYYEYLHILKRARFQINDLNDFRGARIWIGPTRSGSYHTSRKFFDFAGIPYSSLIDISEKSSETQTGKVMTFLDAAEGLYQGKVDVVMYVAVAGDSQIHNAFCKGSIDFYKMDFGLRRQFTLEKKGFGPQHQTTQGEILENSYKCNGKHVIFNPTIPTIAVPVLLLGKKGGTKSIVDILKPVISTFEKHLESKNIISPGRIRNAANLIESELPLNATVREKKKSINFIWWGSLIATLLVLVGLLFWIRRHRHRVQKFFSNHRIYGFCFVILTIFLVSVMGTYFFEHEWNPAFSNPPDALWSVLIYFTSGMEDRVLFTSGGKVFAVIALLMGPIMVACITGFVASKLVISFLEDKMPGKLEDHFVILNWNQRAVYVIRQLKNEALKMDSTIVIVSDDSELNFKKLEEQQKQFEDKNKEQKRLFEDVYFSAGDPTDERTLLNSNVQDAKSILILADSSLGTHADEKTLRTLFTLNRILKDFKHSHSHHVVVELVDMNNLVIIEEIKHTFPGILDVVASSHVRTLLLSQAMLQEGIIDFFTDILQVSTETNEIYTKEIPESAAGLKFPEYASRILAHKLNVPLIPVGVLRKSNGHYHLFSNPKPETDGYVLQKGDRLLVVSYEAPEEDDFPEIKMQ